MTIQIPRPDSSLFIDPVTGQPHRVWYRFWENSQNITLNVENLATGKVWIGSATNLPSPQTISGDATLSVVGVLTVANDAISFAKMQNIATDSLIGRDTTGTGDPENILLNATLSMDGAGNLQRSALTGDLSASAGSNTTTLATVNSNVGTFGSATAVSQVTVNGKGLTTAAADVTIAIPSTQVTDFNEAAQDAVGGIVGNTTTVNLTYSDATPSITGVVNADSIDNTLLANMAQATVKGRAAAAGTGDPTDLSAAQVATIINASLDHGTLGGLTDDDHTQYLLASGTRALSANWDAGSFEIRAQTFQSDVATGTAPMIIASTTKVTNLNADLLDDQSGAYYLDSANFTGANWTDLTDAGDTTLHQHSAVTVANEAADTTCFVNFTTAATGNLQPKTNANLTFNSSTGVFTSASAVLTTADINGGTLDGSVIGGASAAAATVTDLTGSGVIQFGDSTSLEIPNSAAPTVNADGEIALDTTVANWSHGIFKGYGGEEQAFLTMPVGSIAAPSDAQVVRYNATNDELEFADVAATVVTVANEATDTTCFPLFVTAATGDLGPKTNANMTFDSSTGVVTFASSVLTTADINGGTADGVTIGGSSAAAATVTSLTDTGLTSGRLPLVSTAGLLSDSSDFTYGTHTITVSTGTSAADAGVLVRSTNGVAPGIAYLALTSGSTDWAISTGPVGTSTLNFGTTIGGSQGFSVTTGGTMTIPDSIVPDANDGAVLGSSALGWSDLFLAEGAVINWDNGDATITQTGNVLSVEGAALMVGDTANANNTAGLTINQGAADDQSFTLKSSDVATALTTGTRGSDAETDDYFSIEKGAATTGGALIKALSESTSAFSFDFQGYCGAPATTDTSSSTGAIIFDALQHDGANDLVDMAANSNLAVWREYDNTGDTLLTRMLLKADDGELHLGNTTLVALDDEDDIQLVRAMQKTSASDGIRLTEHDNPFYNYDKLRACGLAGEKDESGFFLFPLQPRLHAHEGAIWQLYLKVVEQGKQIASLTQRLALLEA